MCGFQVNRCGAAVLLLLVVPTQGLTLFKTHAQYRNKGYYPAFIQKAATEYDPITGLKVDSKEQMQTEMGSGSLFFSTKSLTYMHVPKTGTSFFNTVVHKSCSKLPEDAKLPSPPPAEQCPGPNCAPSSQMMEFEKKYPSKEYCPDGMDQPETGGAFHQGLQEDGPLAYSNHKGHLVTMLRNPEERLLSQYKYFKSNLPLDQYAPAAAGCAASMITGKPCSYLAVTPQDAKKDLNVTEAVKRLRDDFAFVGLTETWQLSVCLFHAMLGGDCLPVEFENDRPGTAGGVTLDALGGWKDPYDGPLYEEAVKLFNERMVEFSVTPQKCATTICPKAKAHFEVLLKQ